MNQHFDSRRAFLQASAAAFTGYSFAPGLASSKLQAASAGQAKSTILFFLCGGHSHTTSPTYPEVPLITRSLIGFQKPPLGVPN